MENKATLAELYLPDYLYETGTVVVMGGTKEITNSVNKNDRHVLGVVVNNPEYKMNTILKQGIPVAYCGRSVCNVTGIINKGDLLVTSSVSGSAMSNNNPKIGTVVGKALESNHNGEKTQIEALIFIG
jgi:hypothetical protein